MSPRISRTRFDTVTFMGIETQRLIRHMRWANSMVYSAVQTLPDEALASYLVHEEWNAATILEHIVSGSEW